MPANEDNYLFLIRDEGTKLQLDNKNSSTAEQHKIIFNSGPMHY